MDIERNAEAAESHESLISMQELDPSPVDDSPMEAYASDYFPEKTEETPALTSRISSLGLSGLGDHGPVWYLTRIQKYSTYAYSIFLTFHVTNVALLPLLTRSLPLSDKYLLLTRPYYQSPPLEPLLITLPLAAHITSGIALRLYRRHQNLQRYGAESRSDRRLIAWPKLSGTSALGYLLTPLVLGHAFVNRVIPWYYDGGSSSIGLEYVSHGFARHPVVSFVGFGVLVVTGVVHSTWGWGKWLGLTPGSVTMGGPEGEMRRKRAWYGVNGVAALVAGIWLAGGLGVVGRGGDVKGWIGKHYDELYSMVPIVGRWA